MPVRKRPDSPFWAYDFTVNGVRFRGSTGKTTKREAVLVEADEKHRVQRLSLKGKNWQLRQVFGAYWNEVGKHCAGHKTIFRQLEHLSDILGRDTRLSALDAAMLMDYRPVRRGTATKGRQIRLHSVNRDFALLRAALGHCARIHGQPMPAIDWKGLKAKEPPHRTRFLAREEWERLLAVAHPSIKPILICAVTTGLRKANILSLDWSQVKLADRMIQVVVKGGKAHSVRFGPPLSAALSTVEPSARKGKVFDARNFRKRWDAAVARANLENFRFHDLRHTFASWARQAGADIADICEALNHSSISMSMRYAHVKADEHVTAFDRVSGLFDAPRVTAAPETAENKEKARA